MGWTGRIGARGGVGLGLLIVVAAALVVDGGRSFSPAFPRGDLLYHWGLTQGILRGELPPGGPYEGLPAYYPPGYHLLLAAVRLVTSLPLPDVTQLVGFAWLPVLPLTTFALARKVSGRGDVALVAATLTVFGGAYNLGADRLWVNSLFLAGHEMYPLYPRDLVFGMLPLAILAFLRAIETDRGGWRWAVVAGALLGACALIQVQLLLPIPFGLAAVAVAAAVVDRTRRRAAAIATLTTGGLAALAISPWLLPTIALIRRNGGIALDSSDALLPARIGFWDYPREFGLFLPLAIVGAGLVLIHLRRADPDPSGLAPAARAAPFVLVPWLAVPWVLAVLYDPSWPLEDALRPQRLWLISSQPAAILAAIGLVAVARHLVGHRWQRPTWTTPAIALIVLAMALPTDVLTVRLLAQTWTEPRYAALHLDTDRVPDMAAVVGDPGPRSTVLAYEDWSSLVWYETGSWVVAVNPPGYAKLAYDPAVFTGHSQADRRADVGRAFGGDPAALVAIADRYRADRILLARRDDRWGVVSQVAGVAAAEPGRSRGHLTMLSGNGWDAEQLAAGSRLIVAPSVPAGPISIEIRVGADLNGRAVGTRSMRLVAVGTGAERDLGTIVAPPTTIDDWQIVGADVTLEPGEQLVVEAIDPVTIQSALGFVAMAAPAGWRVSVATADAVVLERISVR